MGLDYNPLIYSGFDLTGTSGGGGGGNPQVVETRVVSSGEAAIKALTLTSVPGVPSEVILDVSGAPSQIYSLDYSISGSTLSWSGLGLDGLLTTGDNIRILYWT